MAKKRRRKKSRRKAPRRKKAHRRPAKKRGKKRGKKGRKLTGAAKAAFLKRMAKGRKKLYGPLGNMTKKIYGFSGEKAREADEDSLY